MEKLKKGVTIGTIVCTGLTALCLIAILFAGTFLGDYTWKIVITSACLGIGGFFTINSLNMIPKNKVIGYVSLGLILASVLLIIIANWTQLGSGLYLKVTVALGLLSVLFNIIVSSGLDLGKQKLGLQIAVYIIVGVTDILATLAIFGALQLKGLLITFLVALIILSIVGVIILRVFAKKAITDIIKTEMDMVKISKNEYQILVEKAAKYDELMAKQNEQTNE